MTEPVDDPGFRLPGFVANYLVPALDEFEDALNRRWRAEVVEYLYRANETGMVLPPEQADEGDPAPNHDRRWEGQLRTHVTGMNAWLGNSHTNPADYCTYVRWVRDGQDGELADVSDHEPPDGGFGDFRSGGDPSDYEYSSCPIGNEVFREIEELAKRERDNVMRAIPLFDAHDLGAVGQAHDSLVELCAILGLDLNNDVGITGHSALATLTDVELQRWLGGATDVAWWAHWTPLVPDILADSDDSDAFFQSTIPTRHYHSQIAACLANLINMRAATILTTRTNVVSAIKSATARLDEYAFEDAKRESDTGFGIMAAGSMMLALFPPTAGVAGGLALFAYLGDSLIDKSSSKMLYQETRDGIVADLNQEIADVRNTLHDNELKYTQSVSGLADDIGALKPSHRALYDFTKESRTDTGVRGFQVDPDETLLIARHCFRASAEYEQTIDALLAVDVADPHLRDASGAAIWADTQLIDIRETFIGFCKTTIARYFEAGEQTKDGLARTYQVDRQAAETWKRYEDQLDAARARQRDGGENPYSPAEPDHNGSERGTGGRSRDHLPQPGDNLLDDQPVNPVPPGRTR